MRADGAAFVQPQTNRDHGVGIGTRTQVQAAQGRQRGVGQKYPRRGLFGQQCLNSERVQTARVRDPVLRARPSGIVVLPGHRRLGRRIVNFVLPRSPAFAAAIEAIAKTSPSSLMGSSGWVRTSPWRPQ